MFPDRARRLAEEGNLCSFGITEAVGAALGGLLGGGALATGIGTGIAGAGLGAGIGTVTSAIEGKPLGEGALFGGITGGAVSGLGPTIGGGLESAGVSAGTATTLGDVAAGAAGGLVGSAATGQSPLTGVLEGGGAGLVSGLNASGGAPPSGPSASTTAAAVSPSAGATGGAGGAAAPGAVALPASGSTTPVDPTSLFGAQPDVTSFQTPLPAGSPALSTNIASGTAQGAGPYTGGTAAGGVNNLLGFLGNNPGLLLGGGVLGLDLLKGNQPLPGQTQVQNQAASEASVGNTLSAYAQSGTLPAGLQDIVNQNTNAGIAKIRSDFAQLGLTGSTMEAEAINQVHQAAAAQTSQLANQLLSQGAQFTGLRNQEFNTLLQSQLSQEQALQNALGSFAGGLAGFRSPTQPAAATGA